MITWPKIPDGPHCAQTRRLSGMGKIPFLQTSQRRRRRRCCLFVMRGRQPGAARRGLPVLFQASPAVELPAIRLDLAKPQSPRQLGVVVVGGEEAAAASAPRDRLCRSCSMIGTGRAGCRLCEPSNTGSGRQWVGRRPSIDVLPRHWGGKSEMLAGRMGR